MIAQSYLRSAPPTMVSNISTASRAGSKGVRMRLMPSEGQEDMLLVTALSWEKEQLFVTADNLLSLGTEGQLELPPAGPSRHTRMVSVKVVFSNPRETPGVLRRGMSLSLPDLGTVEREVIESLFQDGAPARPPEPAPEPGPEPLAQQPTPIVADAGSDFVPRMTKSPFDEDDDEDEDEDEEYEDDEDWEYDEPSPLRFVFLLLVLGGLGYGGWWYWENHVKEPPPPPPPVVQPVTPKEPPRIKPVEPVNQVGELTRERYQAYAPVAREVLAALEAQDLAALRDGLKPARAAAMPGAEEIASLAALEVGLEALIRAAEAGQKADRAIYSEGVEWGPKSGTLYKDMDSFVRAQRAAASSALRAAESLAALVDEILDAPDPFLEDTDDQPMSEVGRIENMLELSQ